MTGGKAARDEMALSRIGQSAFASRDSFHATDFWPPASRILTPPLCAEDATSADPRRACTMDRQSIFTTDVLGDLVDDNEAASQKKILQKLVSFLLEFEIDNTFRYR